MEAIKKEFLLGVDANDEIIFCKMERTSDGRFSMSFQTVRPLLGRDFDAYEYCEEYYSREQIGDAEYLNLLEEYDCSPSELASKIAENSFDPRDYLDCSLFDKEINVDGDLWYFESCSCGQHDTREVGMKIHVNEKAYDLIHEAWDKYHLKLIPKEELNKVLEAIEDIQCSYTSEEEWIENYIRRYY